jgi:glutamate 5-kinase
MEVMLANGVIPIVNENDAASVTELMFTDNDELSGMVATMMNADALVILSNVNGIYNGNPADKNAEIIEEITSQKTDIAKYIRTEKSNFGRGGMLTKARMARKVADEGIEVIIANGKTENILVDLILNNNNNVICTRFVPDAHFVSSVKKWIAHSDDFAKGAIYINQGAYEALKQPKAVSLLPVGVERAEGDFEKNDIVQIISPKGENIGVGRVNMSNEKTKQIMGKKGGKPLIHYDYMYLNK